MTRQRGASRGVNLKKYNQHTKTTPSEAQSGTIWPSAAHLAASVVKSGKAEELCTGNAEQVQGGEELATLRARTARALAGLQRGLAAVRLQRAGRRRLAMRQYEGLQVRRARAGELEAKDKLENMGLKKQQLFQAVEGLQDAAGEWLIARAGLQDEGEPEWLVRAGLELEQMLQHWQRQQEERLGGERETQQRGPEGTPPNGGRQDRRATRGNAMSPVKFGGFGNAVRAEAPARKQAGGRQREMRIELNAAARDAAALGAHDAAGHAVLVEAQVYAASVQAEQEREERQLRAERVAVAMRASMDQGGVGSCLEEREEVDEQFRELCNAAGVRPEDIYLPMAIKRTDHTVEERVFARKCRRAGVPAACGGQRERLKRLHVARARAEVFMRASLGANWRRVAERNLEASRARYAAQQWLAKEAQWKASGGESGGGGVGG